MKYKLYSFCIVLAAFLFFGIESSIAQGGPPNSMNYQAVARNTSGALITNQSVTVRFTFHANSAAGTIEYQETQNLTTNQFGLFSASIGQGSVVSGSWSAISFTGADQYLQVEFDAAGGSSFVNMGTSQMLSVPYAQVANYAYNTNWNEASGFIYNTNSGNVTVGSSSVTSGKFSVIPAAGQDAVFIGDPVDGYALYCSKSGANEGIFISKTSISSGTPSIHADVSGANTAIEGYSYGNGTGVYGYGYTGVSGSTSGGGYGLYGYSSISTGYAGAFQGRTNVNFENDNAGIAVPNQNAFSVNGGTSPLWYPGISIYSSGQSDGGVTLYGSYFDELQVADANSGAYANITALAFNVASDMRMKNSINNISSNFYAKYIDYIRNIQSATFWYNTETKEKRTAPHIGVIAQSLPLELQAKIAAEPGLSKSEERLGVSLADLSGLLVVGVKALDEKQTTFENEVAGLENKVAAQQSEIAQLRAQLAEIKSLLEKK